ncbi:hypothetical protein TSUD_161900 [Trifolium subterraneum]|uniref:Uncharacterized protein n=1 Tax=Trifolium subterraneum TaxID=3900 RepID=A0A2Z6N1C3_TRISU|nr:hypothetical protein TSUD_161900 [Trifolium subterraneum]
MLPIESGQTDSVGQYFKTMSGSRDHRSGLYTFDCPKLSVSYYNTPLPYFLSKLSRRVRRSECVSFRWLKRLVEEPHHFQCGFDSIVPKFSDDCLCSAVPLWFDHQFNRVSIIRIKESDLHVDWLGYVFGAQITFKASQRVIMKEWGLHMLTKKDLEDSEKRIGNKDLTKNCPILVSDNVEESNNKFDPKIQLPYNWLLSDEDEAVIDETKRKEIDLSNLGLLTN